MIFFNKIKLILDDIHPVADEFILRRVGQVQHFDGALAASFAKAYEYNLTVLTAENEDAFLMMPTLRSLCEDLIALKFVADKFPQNKNKVVELKMLEEHYKSCIAQWEFFTLHHPGQKLYYDDNFISELDKVKNELHSLMYIFKTNQNATMPSVAFMARNAGLEGLYKYVYHATSSLVHFNPSVLLRMGWGNEEVKFSTRNFGVYYKHFACFYGIYLFILLCRWLVSLNYVDAKIEDKVSQLDQLLHDEIRWPELVTFEEMNIGTFQKILMFKSPEEISSDKAATT